MNYFLGDVTDIITALMYHTEKAIILEADGDTDGVLDEGYLSRFWNWLKNADVSFDKAEYSVPSAGKLVMEMKTRPSFRQQIRKTVAAHFTRFINEAREELILLQDKVIEKLNKDGIVIIFDSLEHLRGITSNWDDVLKSSEQVFRGNAPYLKLPVHVIYTVPAALTNRVKQVYFLPMIKVRHKDESPFEPGIEAALELIRRRIPGDILEKLFGPAPRDPMVRLVQCTGGYPREIVQMMQSVIAQTKHPVSSSALEHIISEIGSEYRGIVFEDAFEWLAKVAYTKYLTMQDEEHRPAADLMLQNHCVLRYLNDELWYELHPAVRRIPGVDRAISKRIKDESGNKDGA